MRVLLCKIHCPFICFCKPSSHIYTAGPLKLEDTPLPLPLPHSHPDSISEDAVAGEAEDKDNRTHQKKRVLNNQNEDEDGNGNSNGHSQNQIANGLRSSLRKSSPPSESESGHNQKKRVRWLDFIGKELAEIREFESSEGEDVEYEGGGNRGCMCSIL